ncbi:transporter substrate-binding domain-containing protein [Desulfonatronum sp. SC1]|uniref:transporter substrate-binding domain-containing protein n=1 Tax=Desulfonatronum sp. SC1 TaxID=2109626 RepID=UPI000D325BEA|nr:transporter substrate-binding domain-containing protein [Desulfonatronum sp. SC1]PTN37320.1 hypothetical protein C6366_06660 [Desulfonatronum sp. SC1]
MPNRFCLINILVVVLVAALLPWSGIAREHDSGSPWPADRTVLIVSADHAYPPYEYLDDGRPAGFNVELIQAVAEAMGLAVEVRLGPWQMVRDDLETGRADVLAGMYYSEERAKTFGFSVPHTIVSSGLFVRGGSAINSLADLRGRRVLVQEGDIMHEYLLANPIASQVVPVQDPERALVLLSEGGYDAALLSSKVQGMYFARRFGLDNLRALETGLPGREYCFAVAKGNDPLVHRLNEGLALLKATNRYREITDKWFGVYEVPRPWEKTWPYLWPALLALTVLALAGFVWSWTLRRTVAQRTSELEVSRERLQTFFLELQDSQRRLRVLLSNLPGMAYRCKNDRNWTMEFVSEGSLPLCGYKPEELVENAAVSYNDLIHPEFREWRWEAWQEALRLKQTLTLEYVIVGKDGAEKWVWEQGRGLFSEDGEVVCLEGFIADITDRKRAEEEREKLNIQLRQAHKMESVGTLAGGIAHDFNNLLQAMSGNIQIMLLRDNDEATSTRLRNIAQSIDRGARLVRQLLQFSRKAVVERQRLNLNHAVEDAARMLERTIPKMVSLELRLQDDLWPVLADPVQVEQVLLNLGTNAADAMPDGGRLILETGNVTLGEEFVRSHFNLEPGPHVLLCVTDTGRGMDETTLAQIFDPFFTTKEMGKGTGLGLASAYGIVTSHGGLVLCYSEPGRGATFRIYWPAAKAVEAAAEADEIPDVPAVPINLDGGETILLVDDDEQILDLTREALEEFGYTVLTASSGEKALAIYADQGHDIGMVVMDLGMPGMGGRQCLRELLTVDSTVRVLIASGYADHKLAEELQRTGAKGFLGKPYQLKELAAKVREVLDG